MKIQAIAANQVDLCMLDDGQSAVPSVVPSAAVAARAATVRANEAVLSKRTRRDVLEEALLDGFLGDDDSDYAGLVAFTRKLRDHSPGLAVQLLKPLLRTDATPSVNVEQQAVFIFGDLPVPQHTDQNAIDVE